MSTRNRSWLLTAMIFGLTLIYLTIWATYAYIHQYDRYQQLAPGAKASLQGRTYQLLSLTQSSELKDKYGEIHPAMAGSVWVIAKISVTSDGTEEFVDCDQPLIGEGDRVWEFDVLGTPERELPSSCSKDDMKIGQPFIYESVTQIPQPYANQLYGVVVNQYVTADPLQVIRPSA